MIIEMSPSREVQDAVGDPEDFQVIAAARAFLLYDADWNGSLTRDEFQDLMDNHSMVSGSVHKKGAGVGSERDPRSQQPVRPPATPEAHRLLGLPSGPERSALVTGMRLRWRSGTGVKSPISRR